MLLISQDYLDGQNVQVPTFAAILILSRWNAKAFQIKHTNIYFYCHCPCKLPGFCFVALHTVPMKDRACICVRFLPALGMVQPASYLKDPAGEHKSRRGKLEEMRVGSLVVKLEASIVFTSK